MVNFFVYAKDFSGSTGGDSHYHNNGLKTLEEFKSHVEKIKTQVLAAGDTTESKVIYLHWGDDCFEVDEGTTKKAYIDKKCGNMGTEAEVIIQWMQRHYDFSVKNNKIKLLYLITDGWINHKSAKKCFELNENMHYESVVFHAFNVNPDSIDFSVAASFFKSHCMVYRNYDLFDSVNISEQFDYDEINIRNFVTERENLKSYIKLKFIKISKHDVLALKEIDKLKKLRNRLFDELIDAHSRNNHNDLDTKDRNVFQHEFTRTDWYMTLTGTDLDIKVDIEKSISTLINYIVNDQKSYSFDALKFDTEYKKPVEEEFIVDVNFAEEENIEFPDIVLDDDKGIPVVILTKFNLLDKIIFHRTEGSDCVSPASFSRFKSAMDCPLFLENDSDVSESIGYFYTLNVYKQFLNSGINSEPRTRKQFLGGLVLTDSEQFDKYNDYILSATYFNYKKVNFNIGLFYYVLWINCDKKEWMDRNVVERFKKYAMRRVSDTVCKIGLSSLPLDPQMNTTLLTALWYCVELSSNIFKDDPEHFMHERLRMYNGVAHHMIDILNYFDYDLDLETIGKRRELISHVTILKRIPVYRDKVYYLLERIFSTVDGFLVSEITKPFNLHTLNYLKLNHKGMLRDDVIREEVHLNDYVHLLNFEVGATPGRKTYEICKKTFRPFFVINQDRSFYTELIKATKRVVILNDHDKDKIKVSYDAIESLEFNKVLSLYNLFINCVKDLEKYPSLTEYIDYVCQRKKFKDDLVTIFSPVVRPNIEDVYKCYQSIVTKVDVEEFIRVSKTYVRRSDRVKGEERLKFVDNKEIEDFICREEIRVKLKKNITK